MKYSAFLRIVGVFIGLIIFLTGSVEGQHKLTGKVIDAQNGHQLAFAHVRLKKQEIQALTNKAGDFQVACALSLADTLLVSYMGYRSRKLPVKPATDSLLVRLSKDTVELKEVLVTDQSAFGLVQEALEHSQENFRQDAFSGQFFYREKDSTKAYMKEHGETWEKGQNAIVGEALFNFWHPGYKRGFLDWKKPQLQLKKGRTIEPPMKIRNRMDSLQGEVDFSIYRPGGPHSLFNQDQVFSVEIDAFKDDADEEFRFGPVLATSYQGEKCWRIPFRPKAVVKGCSKEGAVFISAANEELVRVTFRYTDACKKQPAIDVSLLNMQIAVHAFSIEFTYQKTEQGRIPSYARMSYTLFMRYKGRKHQMKMRTRSWAEMVLTRLHPLAKPIDKDKQFGKREHLGETIKDYNKGFWEDYTVIPYNKRTQAK